MTAYVRPGYLVALLLAVTALLGVLSP